MVMLVYIIYIYTLRKVIFAKKNLKLPDSQKYVFLDRDIGPNEDDLES